MAVNPIAPASATTIGAVDRTSEGGASDPDAIGDAITGLLGSVEQSGRDANTAVSRMMDGSGDVHDAMIALQRAEISFELTTQIRNKLIEAYQQIMRMPV